MWIITENYDCIMRIWLHICRDVDEVALVSWSKMNEFWKLCSQKDGKVSIPWLLFEHHFQNGMENCNDCSRRTVMNGIMAVERSDGFIYIYEYIQQTDWWIVMVSFRFSQFHPQNRGFLTSIFKGFSKHLTREPSMISWGWYTCLSARVWKLS